MADTKAARSGVQQSQIDADNCVERVTRRQRIHRNRGDECWLCFAPAHLTEKSHVLIFFVSLIDFFLPLQ
jgi:hypothetical protein